MKALIANNESEKAFEESLLDFCNYSTYTLRNQGRYSLNLFVNSSDEYLVKYDGYNKILLECMQDYFDNSIQIFNDNRATENDLEKAYIVALGNRIIGTGTDLNKIYNATDNTGKVTNNLDQMNSVNTSIKEIYANNR